MRGQSSRTSSTMWVDRITVVLEPMALRRFRKRLRSAGSRPAVGSSTMMSLGLASRAWAMPKRCFMPPEKVLRAFLRASQRLVWCRSASTMSLRSPLSVTPLRMPR